MWRIVTLSHVTGRNRELVTFDVYYVAKKEFDKTPLGGNSI